MKIVGFFLRPVFVLIFGFVFDGFGGNFEVPERYFDLGSLDLANSLG